MNKFLVLVMVSLVPFLIFGQEQTQTQTADKAPGKKEKKVTEKKPSTKPEPQKIEVPEDLQERENRISLIEKQIQLTEELKRTKKALEASRGPKGKAAVKQYEKEEDLKEKWAVKRANAIKSVALSGCPLDEAFLKSTPITDGGVTVTIEGWTTIGNRLYVDLGGVFIDDEATGDWSNQDYGRYVVTNGEADSIDEIREVSPRKSLPVAMHLCSGGTISLYRSMHYLGFDGNTMTYEYQAKGRLKDGGLGFAKSGSIYLDQRNAQDKTNKARTWVIRLNKVQ